MTFYILDHGPTADERYSIALVQDGFSLSFNGNEVIDVLATRPTQRAAEELVARIRNQEKERGR